MNLPEDIRILFLDDSRRPSTIFGDLIGHEQVHVDHAETYDEFVDLVKKNVEEYDLVSFDHDLGEEGDGARTGHNAAYFMLEHCMNKGKDVPKFSVHSSNSVGGDRIVQMLGKYAENVPIRKVSKL